MKRLNISFLESQIGRLRVAVDDEERLVAICFESEDEEQLMQSWSKKGFTIRQDPTSGEKVRAQLTSYFNGNLSRFELQLSPLGTTFQCRVWDALTEIPYGETCSYRDVAERIGAPKAVRAVGAANGRNPIPIVIPCHRVIGSNGKLTGYAGGLKIKEKLLSLESKQAQLFAAN